jgi:hypothetical protein
MTALSWQKPKLKFDFNGEVFDWHPDGPKVEEINLQSFFQEPGEQSYMREPVALQVRFQHPFLRNFDQVNEDSLATK